MPIPPNYSIRSDLLTNSFFRRRDFTINALFYNLNQRGIEDLTGFGLQDLHDGNEIVW